MDPCLPLRTVIATLLAALLAGAPASAQVFGDDFANTTPGTYWQSVSGNPALAITETAGRLQYSSTQSTSVAAMAFAGYASANWRIRTTSEFRARVTLRSALAGTGASAGSEVGVGINLHRFGAAPAPNQLRPGIAAWLGTRRFDAGAFRTLVVAETSTAGAPMPLMRLWAPTSNQTAFYDVSTGSFVRSIGAETVLYVRYDPLDDALYLSTVGYLDPDAYEYLDFMGSQLEPVQFSIGGFGQQPGNLTGNDTWLDTFRVDSGVVESAPTNVVATDGTSTSVVRVTWTAGLNATGYQVLRTIAGGAAQLVGTVVPSVTAFDDATAAPLQQYTYTVRSVGPSGPGFDASDVGWRGLPAPTGVVASDGTSVAGVALSWGALANVQGYRVFRAIGSGAATEVGAPTANTYIDTSAVAGVVYTYTVKARGATGDGPASAADTGWRNVAAPSGVSATDGTSTANVTVTWTAVPGATGHKVFRAVGTAAATQVAALGATAATYADTTAAAGTVCTYTVRATTAAGDSAASAADTGWRNIAAPAGLAATDGTVTTGVNLTWTAVTGAAGYRVFRAVGTGAATELGAPAAASFSDTTAVAGTVYTYTVKARTAAGNSAASASNTGWRNVAAPAGLAASDGTSTAAVNLTWTAVAGATGHKVFRAVGTGAATEIASLGATAATHADATAVAGTVYTYTVKAVTAAGTSAASASNTGWRNVAAPSGVSATDGTSTANVTVTWTAVPGATGHKVFRAVGTAAATQVAALGATAATYADTTAAAGTVCTYTVRATTAAGDSAASAADTGWRNIAAPAGLAATDGTFTDKVRVTWTAHASTLVTGYRVLRRLPSETSFTVIATISGRTTVTHNDTTIPVAITGTYVVQAVMAAGATASSSTDTGFRAGAPGGAPPAGGMPPPGGEGGTAGNEPPSTGMNPPDGGAGGGSGAGGGAGQGDGTSGGGGGGPGAGPGSSRGDDAASSECDDLAVRIAGLIAAAGAPGASGEEDGLRNLLEPAPRVHGVEPIQPTMSAACAILGGDANLDGRVDAADALLFAEAWCTGDRILADVDRDGVITERDLDATLRALRRHGVGDASERGPDAR